MKAVQYPLLFSLKWCRLRPFLKRVLPDQAHKIVGLLRSQFQPALYQHSPISLTIPKYYDHQIPLPSTESLPVVSIVTPSFNQGQFLEQTMQSILGQKYPNLEYIVQDGGSTDGTLQILEKYRPELKHVESREDTGQANALNLGFRHASGEIMAWLNADDVLLPGTLPCIVNFFLEHPDVDVVYGYRICFDEHDNEVGRWILPSHDDSILPWANYIPQETLFWRRGIWEKAGGYIDESYQFAMDWELLLRFHQAGAKFARLSRFLGAFRGHSAQKTKVWDAIGQQERKRLHNQYHGRPVEWLEIRYHVRHYLIRTAWLYLWYYVRSATTKFLQQKLRFCTPKEG